MNVGKMIMGGAIGLILGTGVLMADTVYWMDKNNTKHYNGNVKVSKAKTMFIASPNIKKGDTRILITQSWGCLSLTQDWDKKDYEKLSNNSVLLHTGYDTWEGVESLGYSDKDKDTNTQVLGKKGCKNIHNSEKWEVQQKKNNKWVTVTKGLFVFFK